MHEFFQTYAPFYGVDGTKETGDKHEYMVTFLGRLSGALGLRDAYSVPVRAKQFGAARLLLYDTYEHVEILSYTVDQLPPPYRHVCADCFGDDEQGCASRPDFVKAELAPFAAEAVCWVCGATPATRQ